MTDKPKRGTDFNDLHVRHPDGLAEVRRQLFAAVEAFDGAQVATARSVDEGYETLLPDDVPPAPPLEAYGSEDGYDPSQEFWFKRLQRVGNQDSAIDVHLSNMELILRHDKRWQGVFGYCEFSYSEKIVKDPPIPTESDELEDEFIDLARVWIHRNYRLRRTPQYADVYQAIKIVSRENRFHPVRDYLESLQWDGEGRLDDWLALCFESQQPPEYLSLAGSKFMIGAVARVMRPGCKMDEMLILEGAQGKGKSTAIKILFDPWFSDAPFSLDGKDHYLLMKGTWGYEVAEMDAFNKGEASQAKLMMSQQVDKYRPPYGKSVIERKRQTVFFGTVNHTEYFKDSTGNRRYWPIACEVVHREWLVQYKEQLWAEALHRYQQGEKWHPASSAETELFMSQQEQRLKLDPWEDLISDYLEVNQPDFITTRELLLDVIGADAKSVNNTTHTGRIGDIMTKRLHWKKTRKRVVLPNGERAKNPRQGYGNPDPSHEIAPF